MNCPKESNCPNELNEFSVDTLGENSDSFANLASHDKIQLLENKHNSYSIIRVNDSWSIYDYLNRYRIVVMIPD